MRTFEDIWADTDLIPGSFTRTSAEQFIIHALDVPENGNIVEVGVDQGRSASLLLEAIQAQQLNVALFLIDSWESILIDNQAKAEALCQKYPTVKYAIFRATSLQGAALWEEPTIDMLHIDANHYAPNPDNDCAAWLPKLKSGGIACFHDYGEGTTFPAVTEAVDKYTAGWEDFGVWDSLAIRRKP